MRAAWQEILERVGTGVLVVSGVLLTLATVYLIPSQPTVALGLAGLAFIGVLALVNPVTLPLLAMPLSVVVARASGGGVDLTISDLIIALAFWPALLLAPRPFSPMLRRLLWLNAIYQALTIFTLVVNPFTANTVEWFHAWLLVSGSLIVGWAVGATGNGRAGLTLFLLACLVLALPTIAQGVLQFASGNFGAVYPRYPIPMHKNFIGMVLAFSALVVYANPPLLAWGRRIAVTSFWIFALGIAFSQSRQALVAVVVGATIITFRGRAQRSRWLLLTLAGVPSIYIVVTMVRDQIASGNIHNSWFQRIDWYTDSVMIWQASPWFGHGLRYWRQPGAPGAFQPPNVLLEVLASTGVLGLVGFFILMGGAVRLLWKLDPAIGTLPLAVLVGRLAQAQLDIYWLSISVSVPFLLTGVCLGVQALDERVLNSSGKTTPALVRSGAKT